MLSFSRPRCIVKHIRSITTITAPKINKSIQRAIYKASSSKEIADICRLKKDEIYHSSIYGKAMEQCSKHRNNVYNATVNDIIKIMDTMLYQRDISFLPIDDVIEFNIFLNAMIKYDKPEICEKYFNLMINNKYKLTPNIIIFSTLIKSCRYQAMYKLAEKYWHSMINEYHITPNNIVCTEMIAVYSKAHKKHKAIQLFDKYQYLADMKMLSAYLSVFSRIGDMDQMCNVLNMFKQKGFKYDASIYADIMNGYFNAKNPEKCIGIYHQLINDGIIPNRTVLGLKCLSLCNMLQNDDKLSMDKKMDYYMEIQDVIKYQYYRFNIKCDIQEYELLLRATILFYQHSNPMKIVEIFEKMIDDKMLTILTDKYNIIDLHNYSPLTAQFILRYILGFKLNEHLNEKDFLWIIVGKGNHRSGKNNKRGNMKQFIMSELLSFDPPIHSNIHHKNNGIITIDKQYLIPYCLNEMNDAKKQLLCISVMDDVYGNIDRKRISQKYMNELITNLKSNIEIEIIDCIDNEYNKGLYKVIKYLNGSSFLLFDLQQKIEISVNFKNIKYSIRARLD